jgi:hypothetical protein
VHAPAVWKLDVPPRLHVFLWLLANNKLLTRDNLAKRRPVEDQACLFCSENETSHHLFFDCYVAKLVWPGISDMLGVSVGVDFESVARWWLNNNQNSVINVVCTTVLWSFWKLHNALCFHGKTQKHGQGSKKSGEGCRRIKNNGKNLSKDAASVILMEARELLRIAW